MNFADIKTEVQLLVRRPDLDARITSAITASVLKIHTTNFYTRDVEQGTITFPDVAIKLSFTKADVSPRFRKVSGILTPTGIQLTHQSMGNMVDYFGYQKQNSFYEAGDSVQVILSTAANSLLVTWFKFPIPVEQDFDSWIADEFPYTIINDAASRVFGQIGNDIQAKFCAGEAAQSLVILNSQNTSQPNYTGV